MSEPIRRPDNPRQILAVPDEVGGYVHIRPRGGPVYSLQIRPSLEPGKLIDVRLVDRTADREG